VRGYGWLKNISTGGLVKCRSLGFARDDDKGEGGAFSEDWFAAEKEQQVTPLRYASAAVILGPREDRGESAGAGFGGSKAPSSMREISTAGVLRLRAQALYHTINL
jgi:hypothetical protein